MPVKWITIPPTPSSPRFCSPSPSSRQTVSPSVSGRLASNSPGEIMPTVPVTITASTGSNSGSNQFSAAICAAAVAASPSNRIVALPRCRST